MPLRVITLLVIELASKQNPIQKGGGGGSVCVWGGRDTRHKGGKGGGSGGTGSPSAGTAEVSVRMRVCGGGVVASPPPLCVCSLGVGKQRGTAPAGQTARVALGGERGGKETVPDHLTHPTTSPHSSAPIPKVTQLGWDRDGAAQPGRPPPPSTPVLGKDGQTDGHDDTTRKCPPTPPRPHTAVASFLTSTSL